MAGTDGLLNAETPASTAARYASSALVSDLKSAIRSAAVHRLRGGRHNPDGGRPAALDDVLCPLAADVLDEPAEGLRGLGGRDQPGV